MGYSDIIPSNIIEKIYVIILNIIGIILLSHVFSLISHISHTIYIKNHRFLESLGNINDFM